MTIAKFLHGAVRSISLGRVLALVFGVLALSAAAAEARPYRLAWDRNTDGLTTGYRVYYGTASGAYQPANGTDVGNVLEFTADLTPGVTYFFAVRAYSSSNLGPPSAELRFTVPLGASINVNTASVAPGATITASVTDGPGNRQDWVGFFPTSVPATGSTTGSTDWKYLNGSRTAPSTGVTGATVSFVAPSAFGTYVVRFYSSTNTLLASSVTISVNGTPTISAPSTVSSGQTIAVAVTNGPATRYDMVALYPSSSTSTSAYIDWRYLNGTQVAPSTGTANANVTFTAPAQAGQYVLRFLSNNGASVLATSGVVTVTSTTAVSVTPNVTTLAAGSSLIAQVRNGPAGRYDRVGLFPVGGSTSIALFYLNGSTTAPATGVSSANVTFTAPQQAGQYNLRFLPNNSTTPTATSATITVTSVTAPTSSTAPTLTPSTTSVLPGGNVTAQVRNGPGGRLDWVALYPVGVGQTAFVDWFYLNGSKAPPSSGTSSANVVFTMPSSGKYMMVLFANNSYSTLSATGTITISTSAPPPTSSTSTSSTASIRSSSAIVAAGSLITVTVTNGTSMRLDWVALYAAGQSGANFLDWSYLNGAKTAPSSGVANASFSFRVPSTPGTYVLRFYTNNSYTVLANSANIFVQ